MLKIQYKHFNHINKEEQEKKYNNCDERTG